MSYPEEVNDRVYVVFLLSKPKFFWKSVLRSISSKIYTQSLVDLVFSNFTSLSHFYYKAMMRVVFKNQSRVVWRSELTIS